MTDTPQDKPKSTSASRRKAAKTPPFKGAVKDHLDAAPLPGKKSRGDMVPRKERKIGQPNKRIRSLVSHIADGKTIVAAAKAAGIPVMPSERPGDSVIARQTLERPYVQDMIAEERAGTARDHKITRKMVIEGLKEAIDMSRMMSEPAIMVAGWREIGKMCGFYEAVKVKVDVTSGGVSLSQKIMNMTDADLLRLACGEVPEDDIIEGEIVG